MISPNLILILILLTFACGIGSIFYLKTRQTIIKVPLISSMLVFILTVFWGINLYHNGTFLFCKNNMIIDTLSMYHIVIVNFVFLATSFYMLDYFDKIVNEDKQTLLYWRRYASLWIAFQAMLLLVLISNNIGLIWIALESTTIVSSFLILSEDSLSVEAMWKYLLICSVGIALAFIGTVLVIGAAHAIPSNDEIYTFSELQQNAHLLNPGLMLFAFIFIVVGFGTKAGLSPMHTWLPDAHSQAPTPVSAVFSAVMLNCALFVIMRYIPIVDITNGTSYAHSILLFFGITSLLTASVFIPIQRDLKRVLAYCSIEHLGIITLCLGVGGFGTVIALFHTLNHSLSKMLAFFSAGSIVKHYKTREMKKISGVLKSMPLWGFAFLISIFALLGLAPFSLFLSEFMLTKTLFTNKEYILLALFLFFITVIFIAMLRQAINIAYGANSMPDSDGSDNKVRVSIYNKVTIGISCCILLVLGIWIPEHLMHILKNAASIIEQGIKL